MSKGVNKVIVIGNLGQDPDVRYVPSGAAVANFSVAVSESWKDKQTGEQKENTEWVNIEVWGKAAEAAAKFLKKGSQCYVEGKLRTDSWDDKDTGHKKYRTKVRADNIQFLGGKPKPNEQAQTPQSDDELHNDIPF